VNDTLKAFRAKFEHKLHMLKEDFETKIRLMREFNRDECKRAEERLDRLENAINQEISDRVTETDEKVGETQEVLTRKSLKPLPIRLAKPV
jgi:Skp family chaperone for outer membrane proteins